MSEDLFYNRDRNISGITAPENFSDLSFTPVYGSRVEYTSKILSYETDDDIIYHIQNEEKKINEIDEELSIRCHNFLNPINYNYIFNSDSYANDNKNFPILYNNTNLPIFF